MRRRAVPILLVLVLAATAARGEDVLVRGRFTQGPGVSLLTPCDSDRGLWVDDFSPAGRELVRRHDEMTTTAYEEIYVELVGWTRSRKAEDGLPEEYDAIFSPTEVVALRPVGEGC